MDMNCVKGLNDGSAFQEVESAPIAVIYIKKGSFHNIFERLEREKSGYHVILCEKKESFMVKPGAVYWLN